MSSRDAILSRIRQCLADDLPRERPQSPEIWPNASSAPEQMPDRFAAELEAVSGEFHRVGSIEEARKKVVQLLAELKAEKVGCMDRPLCRDLVAELPPGQVDWGTPAGEPKAMADLDASVVEADLLLADTGTAMIACGTPHERLLCYLPPACIVAARIERLFEHMPAAWDEIVRRAGDPALRGEFVFVTGPSRTADIEKILILGVHGPQRLIVLLIG
jgi:L-lactate dehydrogenase complex protein LldG